MSIPAEKNRRKICVLPGGAGSLYSMDYVAFVAPLTHPGFHRADGTLDKSNVSCAISGNTARNFYLLEGYSVQVSADESGTLTVTGEPVTWETYSGTVQFTIRLYGAAP